MTGYVTHYAGARDQTWRTPESLFRMLDAEFAFDLDGAATADNALVAEWSSYALTWQGRRVFCNPPWNQIAAFVELAGLADLAVLLVPARVNAKWFHRALELGAEVRFFKGRPRFNDGPSNSPVDCLFLIFRSGSPGEDR